MFSKSMFLLSALFVIQMIAVSVQTNIGPLALSGSVLAALAALSLGVLSRKAAPVSSEAPLSEAASEEAAQPQTSPGKSGTYMLLFSLFCGIRLFYYHLVNPYAASDFQEICILITGIASFLGGIIMKQRKRKENGSSPKR